MRTSWVFCVHSGSYRYFCLSLFLFRSQFGQCWWLLTPYSETHIDTRLPYKLHYLPKNHQNFTLTNIYPAFQMPKCFLLLFLTTIIFLLFHSALNEAFTLLDGPQCLSLLLCTSIWIPFAFATGAKRQKSIALTPKIDVESTVTKQTRTKTFFMASFT